MEIKEDFRLKKIIATGVYYVSLILFSCRKVATHFGGYCLPLCYYLLHGLLYCGCLPGLWGILFGSGGVGRPSPRAASVPG